MSDLRFLLILLASCGASYLFLDVLVVVWPYVIAFWVASLSVSLLSAWASK